MSRDLAFEKVRIHTYGYGSDYLKGKGDCFNVHHFGKGLLAAISTSPYLAASSTTIVAIGHSLGGLVIKKAYMLAKHDAIHTSLANRFAAIFFLATPHRGADSAKLLKNILRVAYDRPYVGDLSPSSTAIQIINDEFRHVSVNLELWSFYETQHMKHFGSLVVEPESALLGYREEKQIPMAADHRSICKFDTTSDANYILLRNALASTVAAGPQRSSADSGTKNHEMKRLRTYLDVANDMDDDFSHFCDTRQDASCEWILSKEDFIHWSSAATSVGQNVLWIKGNPAAGKSVLSSFIIENLRESGQICSFFFFKHGDKFKSKLGRCLRHWAYQMAESDRSCRDALKQKEADGINLEHMDERTIWRMMFQSGMLRNLQTTHYFVIDALDECSDASVLFDTILPSIDATVPLKVLIMSRDTPFISQGMSSLSAEYLLHITISEQDTLPDLKHIVESKIQLLGTVQDDSRDSLVASILEKSKGSFLWTTLVLKELVSCYTSSEIHQVLKEVPKGMEPLYRRTLNQMELVPRGKALAKAALLWTTCAIRPMTVDELNGALKLDIKDTFPQLRESIAALCGQLVVTDKAGRVQMIHETAREFLLSEDNTSEFSVSAPKAHTHMAKVCLMYLTSDEMKPPRIMRRRNSVETRDAFSTYAYYAYSYHLSKADPSSLDLFTLVETFLHSNILTWIEAMASNKTLKQLIRSSNHLRAYATACAVEHSPVNARVQILQQWPRDLARATAMFSTALVASPSAIYSLIPPLCPRNSRLHHTAMSSRRLKVLGGAISDQWGDRLVGIDFERGQPTALCYGERFLAIGLSTGAVYLYHLASYQEYQILQHGESVAFIQFKKRTSFLATCGFKTVKFWNLQTGEMLHSFKSPPRPLDLQFQENLLMVASHKNYITSWDVTDGDAPEGTETNWVAGDVGGAKFGTATVVALSAAHKLLAVAYIGRPITVWDTDETSIIGTCGKKLASGETSTHPVTALVFNPNPSVGLLAATYLDGSLALLDPLEDRQVECFRANCQSLAASPNGRLLAAGGADGIIHVFEFDTLRLLYKVKSQNSFIKKLCFASDSFIFADLRARRCTVWEPEAILRDSLGDDSSGITTSTVVEVTNADASCNITVVAVPKNAEVIFCGRDDGSVVCHSAATAAYVSTLYQHKGPIRRMECWEDGAGIGLLSVDDANRILLYDIRNVGASKPLAATSVCQVDVEDIGAITDVLIHKPAERFLAVSLHSHHLFDLQKGTEVRTHSADTTTTTSRLAETGGGRWAHHPTNAGYLLCIDQDNVFIYTWADLSTVKVLSLDFISASQGSAQLQCALVYRETSVQRLVGLVSNSATGTVQIGLIDGFGDSHSSLPELELRTKSARKPNNAVRQLEMVGDERATDKSSSSGTAHEQQVLSFSEIITNRLEIAHVLGINPSGAFVFLDRASWVCSVDLKAHQGRPSGEVGEGRVKRHFFLPHTWFAGRRGMISGLVRRDVVLARGG